MTPVNDAPVATDSSAQVAEDTPEDVPLHATDIDGDPLTYAIVTPPAHGTLSGSGATRTYTPDRHYFGPDSFTFKANDGTADSNVATVSITVTRRDPATVNINDVSTQEGDAGETDAVFTVSISQPPTDTVVIDAASTDGTAHEPGDYGAMSTRLTFDPGQSSKTVVVKVHGDTLDEPDENYVVNLTVVSGDVVLGDGQGEGTIVDDDPLAGLAVGDTSVTEGNSGTTTATLPVTLSTASGKTVTVDWHTADGTAQAPADYSSARAARSRSHPGETTKQRHRLGQRRHADRARRDVPRPADERRRTRPSRTALEWGLIVNDDFGRPAASASATATASAASATAASAASSRRHHRHRRPLRPSRESRGRSSATAARSWARPSATSSWGRSTAT